MTYGEERLLHIVYRILIPLAVLLGILLLPACGTVPPQPQSEDARSAGVVTTGREAGHRHTGVPGSAEPSGHSLFHLDSEWWDQHGELRTLESLGGKVQVVSMVYTHCAYACPRIISDMRRIGSALGERSDQVRFVLVSIDPERDTPERLAEFAEDLRLDPEQWTVLSAPEGAVLELAAVLGVRYVRESETDFGHTNLLAVLSPTGELVHRQLGVGEGVENTIRAIRAMFGE
jgi:protein SCO1